MILAELRDYMKQHRRALLTEMANRFDVEPDALRSMLERWISKGKIRRIDSAGACASGCSKCDPDQIELYVWVD